MNKFISPQQFDREARALLRTIRLERLLHVACAHPTVSQYARHCFYEWKRIWQLTGIPANA